MAFTYCKVTLVGRLGRDAEVRHFGNGGCVATLSVVTDARRKVDGEWTSVPSWHRVKAFDKLGELAGRFCRKGVRVFIEGTLETNEYTDRDGARKKSVEVYAREMIFFHGEDGPGRSSRDGQYGGTDAGGSGGRAAEGSVDAPSPPADDSIPF